MSAEDYLFGFDMSSEIILNNPDEIDFDKIVAWDLMPNFAIIRQNRGAWNDPWFHVIRDILGPFMPVGSYCVLSPYDSLDGQLSSWFNWVNDPGTMGRWVDYEPVGGKIADAASLRHVVSSVEQHDGETGRVYSRRKLVDDYLGGISTEQLNKWWWWFAQYLFAQTIRGEYPPENMTLAKRVLRDRVVILQTASKLPAPVGAVPHAEEFDRDRWVGVKSLVGFTTGNGGRPLPLTLEERVSKIEREARQRGWSI